MAFNKSDLIDESQRLVLRGLEPQAVFVSARTGEGIDELLARIADLIPQPEIEVTLLVPYDRGDIISRLHENGRVLTTSTTRRARGSPPWSIRGSSTSSRRSRRYTRGNTACAA